jgi:hypothetical protein
MLASKMLVDGLSASARIQRIPRVRQCHSFSISISTAFAPCQEWKVRERRAMSVGSDAKARGAFK